MINGLRIKRPNPSLLLPSCSWTSTATVWPTACWLRGSSMARASHSSWRTGMLSGGSPWISVFKGFGHPAGSGSDLTHWSKKTNLEMSNFLEVNLFIVWSQFTTWKCNDHRLFLIILIRNTDFHRLLL